MSCFISCYDVKNTDAPDTLKCFQVPEEVYIYVLQLEAYIQHPEKSKLKEAYDFRFKKK